MKLTIVEKNLLSWTAMHIDFVMCKNSDIALYSGYYVQISDSIEKKYWWICIEKT